VPKDTLNIVTAPVQLSFTLQLDCAPNDASRVLAPLLSRLEPFIKEAVAACLDEHMSSAGDRGPIIDFALGELISK